MTAEPELFHELLNPDGFDVCEFADAKSAQFASVSGPLHAAERQPRVGCYHAINKNHSGFDLVDQALAFLFVIGVMLIADGFDHHVPRGYVYFAMAFSVCVEMLNLRLRKRAARPVELRDRYARRDE